MKDNGFSQLLTLSKKWLPHEDITTDSMARAFFIEQQYWEKFEARTIRAIGIAFNGK